MGKYRVQKSTKVLETKKNSLHILTKKRFQQLNQYLYKKFHAFNSSGSGFSKGGVVDGDKWQPPSKVYYKRKGSKAQALIWRSFDDKEPSWNLI